MTSKVNLTKTETDLPPKPTEDTVIDMEEGCPPDNDKETVSIEMFDEEINKKIDEFDAGNGGRDVTGDVPGSNVDMKEDAPCLPENDKKETISNKKKDDFESGDTGGIRPDVRHAFHYYSNPNKVGAHNHIVGVLTPTEEKLNDIVMSVDHVSSYVGQITTVLDAGYVNRITTLLDNLRKQICDFANGGSGN